jgi:hypothetical protein
MVTAPSPSKDQHMSDTTLTTGETAALLRRFDPRVTEPRLADDVRNLRIPAPPVRAGRRFWAREHVLAAAARFGIDPVAVTAALHAVGGAR